RPYEEGCAPAWKARLLETRNLNRDTAVDGKGLVLSSRSMLRAVIFDMDGVLIDSEPFWHQAEMESFALAGVRLTHEDCLSTTGLRVDAVVDHWLARRPWTAPSPCEIEAAIVCWVIELIRERGMRKLGVDGALAVAVCAGLRVALASSSL